MSLLSIPAKNNMDVIAQQELFKQYVSRDKYELSAYAFVNIFLWKDFFSFRFEVINGQLCVFAENEIGRFLYLPPLGGQIKPKTIEQCFQIMEEMNQGSGVSRIENVEESQLRFFPEERYARYLKSKDYCYAREDIAGLKGNPFKDKRNAYNACIKQYVPSFKEYTSEMRDDCLALYARWAKDRRAHHPDPVFGQMLDDNLIVHKNALEFCADLGLIGRVVEIDGKIQGYTFGYPLHEEMFCVLLEVSDLSCKGLSVYIFREFCRDKALKAYRYINAMDDFAMPELQRTKMSYQPVKMIPSYNITRKGS